MIPINKKQLLSVFMLFSLCTRLYAADVPFGLKWGMRSPQIKAAFYENGYEDWDTLVPGVTDTPDVKATSKAMRELGYTYLYFKTTKKIPHERVHVLLYQGKLYSFAIRYHDASITFKEKTKQELQRKLGVAEKTLEVKDPGKNPDKNMMVSAWGTDKTLIIFGYNFIDQGNPYLNFTRLSYTDLITKRKLGPGAP